MPVQFVENLKEMWRERDAAPRSRKAGRHHTRACGTMTEAAAGSRCSPRARPTRPGCSARCCR